MFICWSSILVATSVVVIYCLTHSNYNFRVLFPFRIFYIKDCLPDTFMNFLRYLYVGYLLDIVIFN